MGLRGHDEEDLAADAEKLFGSNAAIDLDTEVHGVPQAHLVGSESVSTGAASGSGGSKKSRSSTSKA
jgi:hypothetical protein